jgi:alkanesulfonate monooxygenase SsuD/methylene tetrahydromethanopterin reductase-like flavin-dependent oxidoreductase (luciferase family)
MKLGLRLPQGSTDLQHDIAETAKAAEAAGYATLWTWEPLLYPVAPKEPVFVTRTMRSAPGAPWPEPYRQVAAPLPVLTAAAMVTTKARLGISVMIAAQHGPVQLAKTLATFDQISGGGVIAVSVAAG